MSNPEPKNFRLVKWSYIFANIRYIYSNIMYIYFQAIGVVNKLYTIHIYVSATNLHI